MKTAECEGIERPAIGLSAPAPRAWNPSSPSPAATTSRPWSMPARSGRKTVVCGAPNCRPGLVTAWVPVGKKVIDGVESDGMLASAAELGINRDHAGIIELDAASRRAARPAASPTASSRSTTSPSPTGPTSGATRHGARSGRHPGAQAEGPGAARPAARRAGRRGDPSRTGPCPRYSALVFENVASSHRPCWLQYRLTAIGLNPITTSWT